MRHWILLFMMLAQTPTLPWLIRRIFADRAAQPVNDQAP